MIAKLRNILENSWRSRSLARNIETLLILPRQVRGDDVRPLRPVGLLAVLNHIPLQQTLRFPAALHERHVRGEVVLHVEGDVVLVGVEDADVESHYCGDMGKVLVGV